MLFLYIQLWESWIWQMFKDTAKDTGKSYLEKYFPQKSLNAFRYGIEFQEKSLKKKERGEWDWIALSV